VPESARRTWKAAFDALRWVRVDLYTLFPNGNCRMQCLSEDWGLNDTKAEPDPCALRAG